MFVGMSKQFMIEIFVYSPSSYEDAKVATK